MAQIHVLDSETIDRIAAGEVVERPSSVVKELTENAIDAGADSVTVEIKDGGIEFIRVTDNGCGMEKNQLRTAFLRHATSKIENALDLNHISSLGFRGEALSSIASVSKVEVITKPKEAVTGSRILLEGARETAFEEVGAPAGTTFLMRNLFFNTPARRKFLKQPLTEGGYIADLMEHLALSRPDISFQFTAGGQLKFHTSGDGDLREVIYRLYGRETAKALIPLQAEKNGIRVEGYLGRPETVRSNRNFEIYFINGRLIKSNVVAKALEEGYKEYLMQHKFPFCVLHFTLDAERVDVNVHPAKMDVRFSNGPGFAGFLTEAVQNALSRREMIPETDLDTEAQLKQRERSFSKERETFHAPQPFETNRVKQYRVLEEAQYEAERPKAQDFLHHPVWERVKRPATGDVSEDASVLTGEKDRRSVSEDVTVLTEGKGRHPATGDVTALTEGKDRHPVSEETSVLAGEDDFFTETSELSDLPETAVPREETAQKETSVLTERKGRHPVSEETSVLAGEDDFFTETSELPDLPETAVFREENSSQGEPPVRENPSVPGTEFAESSGKKEPESQQLNLFDEKILVPDKRNRFRVIGQVFETYWLVQYEDKLLMIDQHAAHEKVNYERLMKQYREKNVISQRLMPPVIVSLSGQEETVLKENWNVFTGLGFEVEAFGGSEYALRSVPVDLYGCDEKRMFLEVLDQLSEGGAFGGIRIVEEKIASMSCKAAVKGNQLLSRPEAEALIDELLTLDNPYNCPHGRPTVISLSRYEMERKFKRVVN